MKVTAYDFLRYGTIDGTVIGYGVLRLEHLRDGSTLGVISDLFTLEGARGVSVGEQVMDALIAWAVERTVWVLFYRPRGPVARYNAGR